MRITILNGNPSAEDLMFETHLVSLQQKLAEENHQVRQLDLREMEIRYCVGCFGCWVKTPGECALVDDAEQVLRAAINCDLLLFTSPLSMGFVSAVLKKTLDRMIPIVLPHLEIAQGEIHHCKRYKHYPVLGLLLAEGRDSDAEDLEIIEQSFHRVAINFKSRLGLVCLTSQPLEEVIDEINRL